MSLDPSRKPRVIGAEVTPLPQPSTPTPRRMPGASEVAAAPQVQRPAPRVLGSSPLTTPQVVVEQVVVDTVSKPFAPRVVPGVIRSGFKATVAELKVLFPQQPVEILTKTVSALAHIPVEGLGWAQAQNLGLDEQKKYAALVQKLLSASSQDVVRVAPRHISRLLVLLEACLEDFENIPSHGITSWLRKDKPSAFESNRDEIDQLRKVLSDRADDLESPIREITEVREQYVELADTLVADGLACEWIADKGQVTDEVKRVLIDRTISLTKTAAQIKQQHIDTLSIAQNLTALRDCIQECVLTTLPTLLAKISNQQFTTNTQKFIIRDELKQIILQLKN